MSVIQAVILGIVQGLTEFLPISSSAHLVLVPFVLNWKLDPHTAFVFNVIVQVGTLVGVAAYFWKDLVNIGNHFVRGLIQRNPLGTTPARQGWLLILATIPAGLIGLVFNDLVEEAFASPAATAVFLLVTAGLLTFAEYAHKRQTNTNSAPGESEVGWREALAMGFGQALAIFPGISRSGATITAGMLRGLGRGTAARFSFLMSVPIMLAAGIFATLDIAGGQEMGNIILPVSAGFITSALTGYYSIGWLLKYLTHRSLMVFSIYCAAAGMLSLALHFLR